MGSFVGGAIHESISQLSRVGSSNEPGEQTKSLLLERVSICWNRKRALAFLVGRIFCGKPPKSAVADLGDIECRSRVYPRSVSTFPENALAPTSTERDTVGRKQCGK